jgi:hypothetical protein
MTEPKDCNNLMFRWPFAYSFGTVIGQDDIARRPMIRLCEVPRTTDIP